MRVSGEYQSSIRRDDRQSGIGVLDIEKFAKAAHEHGVPLIVDNTFATPINCRPFEWGADIVTHSTTKYMDGHASCVGGAVSWTAATLTGKHMLINSQV